MQELIGKFYEDDKRPDSPYLPIGGLFIGPVFFADAELRRLVPTWVDPYHKKQPLLSMRKLDEDAFKNNQPIKELNLRDDEEILALRAKKRPVIISSSPLDPWHHISGEKQDESYFCLPLFSLEGYDDEFILNLKALRFNSLFYLPGDPKFGIKESFIRFDRSQVLHRQCIERFRPKVCLTEDAMLVIQGWFQFYFTGRAEDWLLDLQKTELEKLKSLSKEKES